MKAFTLLELILAMAVSMIVFGGLYAIADGTIQMGGEIATRQDRMLARETFVEWCRTSFREIPSNGSIFLREGIGDEEGLPVVEIAASPGSFLVGSSVRPEDGVVSLALRKASAEVFELGGNFPLLVEGSVDFELEERWLSLLQGVTSCRWRVQESGEWLEASEGENRPTFVELELGLDGEDPVRHVFWVPPAAEVQTESPKGAVGGAGIPTGAAAAPSAGVNGGVGAPPTLTPPSLSPPSSRR